MSEIDWDELLATALADLADLVARRPTPPRVDFFTAAMNELAPLTAEEE